MKRQIKRALSVLLLLAALLPLGGCSAQAGHVIAQYNVGVFYDKGYGVAQDYKAAMEWWKKAAEAGSASAMSNIGWLYYNGYGVAQDYEAAMEWYQKAAEAGDETAKENLQSLKSRGY